LAASQTRKYEIQLHPAFPVQKNAGKASDVGFAPKWKGVASLAWERGPVAADFYARYVGRYEDFGASTRQLGNFWLIDLNARLELAKILQTRSDFLKNAHVSVGVVNLFDKLPEFTSSSPTFAVDLTQYDLRGRFVHAQVGLRF
jgi:iron complex outermembrane recepter protein